MKLPRLAAPGPRPDRSPGRRGLVPSAPDYVLQTCTTNLGATADHPGDPVLKHCLVHIRDRHGQRLRSLSIGRDGLGPEGHADVASTVCDADPPTVTGAQLRRFERALEGCAYAGYRWGERDCCSCLEHAFARGLGRAAPPAIRSAAAELARAPDPQAR